MIPISTCPRRSHRNSIDRPLAWDDPLGLPIATSTTGPPVSADTPRNRDAVLIAAPRSPGSDDAPAQVVKLPGQARCEARPGVPLLLGEVTNLPGHVLLEEEG